MIGPPAGVRVYLACGVTDMRKGMIGLAMLVQQVLADDPFSGALFAFRGRSAGLIKVLWHDGDRAVPADQKIGARPIRLAVGDGDRRRGTFCGAARDTAGRVRMARPGSRPQARVGRIEIAQTQS